MEVIMGLLFLDFDGVINSEIFYFSPKCLFDIGNQDVMFALFRHAPHRHIDQKALSYVREFCEISGVDIVVSSNWRALYGKDDFIRIFEQCGWEDAPIIGTTPSVNPGTRGDEILMWIKDNHYAGDYVILDDVDDFYSDQAFFKTDPKVGFTLNHIKPLLNVLSSRRGLDSLCMSTNTRVPSW